MDVDKLNPLELDEMADIIADAIQAVDAEEEKENAAGKVEGGRAEQKGNAEGKDEYETGLMDESYRAQGTRSRFFYFQRNWVVWKCLKAALQTKGGSLLTCFAACSLPPSPAACSHPAAPTRGWPEGELPHQ